MAGAPVPLFDNLWSAEEKWDVKSDGDWRGREFTPTVSNDVIKTAEEDMTSSSAAAYFCNAQGWLTKQILLLLRAVKNIYDAFFFTNSAKTPLYLHSIE